MPDRCVKESQFIGEVGWLKLWDSAMDLGCRHVRGLQNLSRMLSTHGTGHAWSVMWNVLPHVQRIAADDLA